MIKASYSFKSAFGSGNRNFPCKLLEDAGKPSYCVYVATAFLFRKHFKYVNTKYDEKAGQLRKKTFLTIFFDNLKKKF